MEDLINLITHEPPYVYNEKTRFRYPYIACEVLSCNNMQIRQKIIYDDHLLQLLYSFIEQEPPLNSLLASFVVQVTSNFFVKNNVSVSVISAKCPNSRSKVPIHFLNSHNIISKIQLRKLKIFCSNIAKHFFICASSGFSCHASLLTWRLFDCKCIWRSVLIVSSVRVT